MAWERNRDRKTRIVAVKTKRQILWFSRRESTNIRSFEWSFSKSLLKEREILAFSCDCEKNIYPWNYKNRIDTTSLICFVDQRTCPIARLLLKASQAISASVTIAILLGIIMTDDDES